MEITEQTFYVVESGDKLSAFDERTDAIDDMRGRVGSGGSPDDLSVYEVSVDDEWSIVGLDWRSIAMELMGGDE